MIKVNIAELPSVPLAMRDTLPSCPAIYFALSPSGDVLYIGRANSLFHRWRSHHRTSQLGGASLAWLSVTDAQSLPALEREFVNYFHPPLNNSPRPVVGNHHVYLLVPPVLYDWLWNSTQAGGFKNVQDKIVDVLRTARESDHQEQQAA